LIPIRAQWSGKIRYRIPHLVYLGSQGRHYQRNCYYDILQNVYFSLEITSRI